jgi:formylglycine-generating enzyme required for sulfatase activity
MALHLSLNKKWFQMKNTTPFIVVLIFSVLSVGFLLSCSDDTPAAPVAPDAPVEVTASLNDAVVTVSWQEVEAATSYDVYRSYNDSSYFFLRSEVTATSCTDPFPQSGANYYKVMAVNGLKSSFSEASPAVTYTPAFDFEPEMVFVQGGTFIMGAQNSDSTAANYIDDNLNPNVKPMHSVTLSDFGIGRFEITRKEWFDVMGEWPEQQLVTLFGVGDDLPIHNMIWSELQEYVTRLNELTGKTYRLLTEAEWEYAERGGRASHYYLYSGSNDLDSVAWHQGNSQLKLYKGGTKYPNELGLYDMTGSVMEWCSDWYGPYSSNAQTNPTGAFFGSSRVLRGSYIGAYETQCRFYYRSYGNTTTFSPFIGIRVAMSAP